MAGVSASSLTHSGITGKLESLNSHESSRMEFRCATGLRAQPPSRFSCRRAGIVRHQSPFPNHDFQPSAHEHKSGYETIRILLPSVPSDAEQKQRSAEVVAWVKQQIADGRKLEPRVLATEHDLVVSEENKSSASTYSGGTLVAINFFEAKDFEEAVKIAKTHPGLRYGLSIEVRPWTDPLAATNAPQSSNSHGMKPRISLLTIGVDDLEKSLRFYRDGLGLPTQGIVGTEFEIGAVAFFDLQSNLKLAIWPRKSLSKATGLPLNKPRATEFSIGHNVASKAEVDAVMQRARNAGAVIVKPAHDTFWGGYAGYFQDPDGHL